MTIYSTPHYKKGSKIVAVVVPFHKDRLAPEQQISYRFLMHFLKTYEKYLVVPDSLEINLPGFRIKRFDDKFFSSFPCYEQLMFSHQFYETFLEYRYILIYQFDCLVFSDQLLEWCQMDFDYIGAPWLKSKSNPSLGFSRVGNGGFSLRKIESFLKVINSKRYVTQSVPYWRDVLFTSLVDICDLNLLSRFVKKLSVFREIRKGVGWYTSHYYTLHEDRFWSDRAKLFYLDFKIAPVDIALRFSFESAPRYCFEKNNYRLPFGCHGWTRWDRTFWESIIQKDFRWALS